MPPRCGRSLAMTCPPSRLTAAATACPTAPAAPVTSTILSCRRIIWPIRGRARRSIEPGGPLGLMFGMGWRRLRLVRDPQRRRRRRSRCFRGGRVLALILAVSDPTERQAGQKRKGADAEHPPGIRDEQREERYHRDEHGQHLF